MRINIESSTRGGHRQLVDVLDWSGWERESWFILLHINEIDCLIMFLGESEQVLNEGVEGGISHPKGRVTASHPVEFGFAAIIEASIISFDSLEP